MFLDAPVKEIADIEKMLSRHALCGAAGALGARRHLVAPLLFEPRVRPSLLHVVDRDAHCRARSSGVGR